MTRELIAIEDGVLPDGTRPAAKSRDDYLRKLAAANARLKDPTRRGSIPHCHLDRMAIQPELGIKKMKQTRLLPAFRPSCWPWLLDSCET